MKERHEERAAPTVDALADRFVAEHLPKRRAATQRDYKSILRLHIRPKLGKLKVAELRHTDIERLHRELAKTAPYSANRSVAVLSKMLALAIKWEMRGDNPARGIEREPEERRERFLSPVEIIKLGEALMAHRERTSANAIRLLLLTGARRGELLSATWTQFDLQKGVWTKPSAATKQKKEHVVPLSAPALTILAEVHAAADPDCPFVFPGKRITDAKGVVTWHPLTEVRKVWISVCKAAGLAAHVQQKDADGKLVKDKAGDPVMVWQPTARLHDLRHSYASILASAGLSLPIIGRLLGHTQAATTNRYAHLMDDPLRAATERVGAVVTGSVQTSAELVHLHPRRA